jgi:L-ribulose-5-phosphate 4-epimerase
MTNDELRRRVYESNMALSGSGLVVLTWGNASEVDRRRGVVAIKPSGVGYNGLAPEDIVIVDLATGETIDGAMRPSSDTPTHLHLYRELPDIGGVVHTHSHYAVCFAQAESSVPCYGTTHADHFHGAIPVTRRLSSEEIDGEYERNTGGVIVEQVRSRGASPLHVPAILVAHHGPFAWGEDSASAVENAIVLEEVCKMTLHTRLISATASQAPQELQDRHFMRKHGADAYYGQPDPRS